MRVEAKAIEFGNAGLKGTLYGDSAARGAVLLSHGAGGNMSTPFIVRAAQLLAADGFLVLAWNVLGVFGGGVPSAGGKREIPELEEAINFLKVQSSTRSGQISPLILMGRSFGGRVSSYVGATRSDIAGYVFFGLPLKGAGKNAKPRDWSHLAKLGGRVLFVTGDKDKLCPPDELKQAQEQMRIAFQSVTVPGDHSFKPKGEEMALQACLKWTKENF